MANTGEAVTSQNLPSLGSLTAVAAQRWAPIDDLLSKLRLSEEERGRLSEGLAGMSSTLVETVSINYEDFNESFLTCGTCLCMYDGADHTPKLMPCSHTVCLDCLTRIVASNSREPAGTLRCPICRALITLPSGGVAALPPSFVVNQLLDLMSRQRREVVPKCATHQTEDLLFCETCDAVFCAQCMETGHSDSGNTSSGEHTIVPFSIAIKRMSEILLYKANECTAKLNKAHEAVQQEIDRLDENVAATFDEINSSFQQLSDCLQRRRDHVLQQVEKTKEEKKKVLEEQLSLIESERSKVQSECDGLQYQVEVRNITRKIGDLNEKLDSVNCLSEPRENSFIRYEYRHNKTVNDLQTCMSQLGRVRTSRTFPGLCQLEPFAAVAHLLSTVHLTALDYHGARRQSGGDPVSVRLSDPDGQQSAVPVRDPDTGQYTLQFRARQSGTHSLDVRVFGRPIKNSPYTFQVSAHNDPVRVAGGGRAGGGSGDDQLCQPVGVAVSRDGTAIYVTDTGNSRLKVYSLRSHRRLEVTQHILGSGLEERGGTGVAVCPSSGRLLLVNWRSRLITEIQTDGALVRQFSHPELRQPIAIAVSSDSLLVADSGRDEVLVFSRDGQQLLRTIGGGGAAAGGRLRQLSAVAVGPDGQVVAADASMVRVFSAEGKLLREMVTESNVRGSYGGVTCDSLGNVLATRSEKSRHYVQVFSLDSGKLQFWIDSDGDRLRRPAGLACTEDGSVFVADLGNHCLKQYRYL